MTSDDYLKALCAQVERLVSEVRDIEARVADLPNKIAAAVARKLEEEVEEERVRVARGRASSTQRRCECRGRGCQCERSPRAAIMTVMREDKEIAVCEWCELPGDDRVAWLDGVMS